MRWCWKYRGGKQIYYGKENKLIETYVKTELDYQECNRSGDEKKKKEESKEDSYW